ncbi:hypothetical protein BCON_0008g01090 [Botryotinia convoluta]|uniref:Uncharacterized protein n=1 Tax=Botryotinia convoluta TaxID=54673 RepID=A0A4Z1IXY9_9HELO|nr:hypothetical protein BCON_0008g01090 [Botryotinia convoluta]
MGGMGYKNLRLEGILILSHQTPQSQFLDFRVCCLFLSSFLQPKFTYQAIPYEPKCKEASGLSDFTSKYFAPFNNGQSPSNRQLSDIFMNNANAAHNFSYGICDKVTKLLTEAEPNAYEGKGGLERHFYRPLAGNVLVESPSRGLYPREVFCHCSGANRTRALDRTIIAADKKVALQQGHDAVINKIIAEQKAPTGQLSVYIGGNMVDLAQFGYRQFSDGRILVTVQAITLPGNHSLSGQATHCLQLNRANPEIVTYVVYGTGDGHWFADKPNGPISNVLWQCNGETLVEMSKFMVSKNEFGSEARDKAYTGLLFSMWKKSPAAGLRRLICTVRMTCATPVGLAMARRITHIPYNLGALVPFDEKKYEGDVEHEKGNRIEIENINWLNVTPEQACALLDPTKFDSTKLIASDTLGGLRDSGRIINMNALLQPSYSLAMTNLAHHISQENLEVVRKTYEKAIQPWITEMKLLELKKSEQEIVTKEMMEIINSSGSEKLVLPKELVHELAWRGTGASVVHAWAWSVFRKLLPDIQDDLAETLPKDTEKEDVKEYLEGLLAETTVDMTTEDKIITQWDIDAAITVAQDHNDPETVQKLKNLLSERTTTLAQTEVTLSAMKQEASINAGVEKESVEREIVDHEVRIEQEKAGKAEVEHALEAVEDGTAAREEVRKREQERMHDIGKVHRYISA